jgi:hypothetical protein
MLAGVPAKEVIDKWHEHIWTALQGETQCFADLTIVAVPLSSVVRSLHKGCVYLIAAQSLNMPQSSHQIIVDCRWEDGYKIYDPQFGNADAKYYIPHYLEISEHLEPNAVKFTGGWHVDYRILECPALGVIR